MTHRYRKGSFSRSTSSGGKKITGRRVFWIQFCSFHIGTDRLLGLKNSKFPPVFGFLGGTPAICVYCGSNAGGDPRFVEAARETGKLIAQRGYQVVYGGGNVGMMGALADAALAAGGEVIGVIPTLLEQRELAHTGLTRLHTVSNMHERKALMASLSDCFLALPGGIGTLEEIIEVLVWSKLGIHPKACGVLNTNGFYDSLMVFLRDMVCQGFLAFDHFTQLRVADEPASAIEQLIAYSPPPRERPDGDVVLEA